MNDSRLMTFDVSETLVKAADDLERAAQDVRNAANEQPLQGRDMVSSAVSKSQTAISAIRNGTNSALSQVESVFWRIEMLHCGLLEQIEHPEEDATNGD